MVLTQTTCEKAAHGTHSGFQQPPTTGTSTPRKGAEGWSWGRAAPGPVPEGRLQATQLPECHLTWLYWGDLGSTSTVAR